MNEDIGEEKEGIDCRRMGLGSAKEEVDNTRRRAIRRTVLMLFLCWEL